MSRGGYRGGYYGGNRRRDKPSYTKEQLTTLGKAAVSQIIDNQQNVTLGSVLRYQTPFCTFPNIVL